MTRKLAELTGPETLNVLAETSILVVPIGAIEHHGPHLPLITDTLVAESVTTAAVTGAVGADLDVWQLPTLSVGKSDEHHWASGTLWLTATTLLDTLVDIGRSVATTPARKLAFVNGHGGNVAMLGVALREIRRQFGLMTFAMPAMRVPDALEPPAAEQGLGIHGGWAETSIVMHLRPELVHTEHFAAHVPPGLAGYRQVGFNTKPVSFGWLSNDFGPSGVIGDPTAATAATGAQIFEFSRAQAVDSLREIHGFTLPG